LAFQCSQRFFPFLVITIKNPIGARIDKGVAIGKFQCHLAVYLGRRGIDAPFFELLGQFLCFHTRFSRRFEDVGDGRHFLGIHPGAVLIDDRLTTSCGGSSPRSPCAECPRVRSGTECPRVRSGACCSRIRSGTSFPRCSSRLRHPGLPLPHIGLGFNPLHLLFSHHFKLFVAWITLPHPVEILNSRYSFHIYLRNDRVFSILHPCYQGIH